MSLIYSIHGSINHSLLWKDEKAHDKYSEFLQCSIGSRNALK